MPFADEERENAMMSIPVDGVPFGERPPEFRRPGSNFYATRHLEARAVAGMLVELGGRDGVVNVIRGDAPDVTVQYADGRAVYVKPAQINEVLCKVLCHDLCCLVHASYRLQPRDRLGE